MASWPVSRRVPRWWSWTWPSKWNHPTELTRNSLMTVTPHGTSSSLTRQIPRGSYNSSYSVLQTTPKSQPRTHTRQITCACRFSFGGYTLAAAELNRLQNLKTLTLSDTAVSNGFYGHLSRIPNLSRLHLWDCTGGTAKGLSQLSFLRHLTHLDTTDSTIEGVECGISDKCLGTGDFSFSQDM